MKTTEQINAHLKALNKGHTVKIRAKALKDGTHSIYLDYWRGLDRKRSFDYLGLRLTGDRTSDKDALLRAEKRRMLAESEILDHGELRSQRYRNADFYEYMEHQTKKRASHNWENALKWLKKYHPKSLPFNRLDKEFIEGFRDYLLQTDMKVNSARLILTVLKAALNQAVKDEYLKANPGTGISIKAEETVKAFLTKEQLAVLKETPCNNNEVKQAFIFACYTGLRISDIMALQWKDIDGDQITIRQKKTKGLVRIPLLDGAKRILESRVGKNGRIFDLPTHQSVSNNLKSWLKAAGIDAAITFHSSRHTFAILALDNNMSVIVLQKLLGHTLLSTTMIYAKIQPSMLKKEMDKFNEYLEGE